MERDDTRGDFFKHVRQKRPFSSLTLTAASWRDVRGLVLVDGRRSESSDDVTACVTRALCRLLTDLSVCQHLDPLLQV